MIRITCTSCQKPLSLDETKLPMREVTFPCPVCKAKLMVDRRTLEGDPPPENEAAEPPVSREPRSESHDSYEDHENELGAKALIVGEDSAAIRQAVKLIGCLPVFYAEPAKAREYFNQEIPQVVILNPEQVSTPPLDSMGAILSVVPSERRRSFYVLVADNLRTLDGNAAFLYGVNLVVATKDLGQFPQIYRDAHQAHDRLYASMLAVLRDRQI